MSNEIEVHSSRQMLNPATDSWMAVSNDVAMLANNIAHTEFVPAGLRGKDGAKVAAAILTGRELGLAPMTALASIHVINGKPGISAEMMRGLVLVAGHEIVVSEVSTQRVVIKGRREGSTEWTTVAWSDADARRAGLSSQNYQKYPRQMLTARATTELCRLIFADVIHGLRSVEELDEFEVDEVVVGDVPAAEPVAAAPVKKVGRKRAVKTQPVDSAPVVEEAAPVAAARKSPPVTRRGKAPEQSSAVQGGGDAGEGSPAVDAGGSNEGLPPALAGIVDAEIVDAEIVEESAVEVIEEPDEPRLTEKQRNLILVRFDQLAVKDRAERLWTSSQIVGRELKSANDLSRSEAGRLIDELARCQTRGDLELLLGSLPAAEGAGQ